MKAVAKPPAFDGGQRLDLKRCGLLPEQISELERNLRTLALWRFKSPPLGAIRKWIRTVSDPLMKASAALEKLEAAAFPDDGPEGPSIERLVPAYFRRTRAKALPSPDALAAYDLLARHGDDQNLPTRLRALAEEANEVTRQVMAAGQRRISAPWQPIDKIVSLLQWGFVLHHDPGLSDRLANKPGAALRKPMPPYLALTVSTSGPFRVVADVCYEAAGLGNPDKAIRNWQRMDDARRERELQRRRAENETLPEAERYRPIDLEFRQRRRGKPAKRK